MERIDAKQEQWSKYGDLQSAARGHTIPWTINAQQSAFEARTVYLRLFHPYKFGASNMAAEATKKRCYANVLALGINDGL